MLRSRTRWWLASCLWLGIALPAAAQLQLHSAPVSQGSRPLSESSTNLGAGSAPVHDGARTIGESSVGSVKSRPVSAPDTRSMLSGPVSEVSRGPVTSGRTMTSGSVHSISAGAVKKDIDRPLGERISDPLTELEPLQETLRALREGRVPAEAVEDEEAAPSLPAVAPAPVPDLGAAPAVGEDLGEGPDGATAGAGAGPPVAGDEFHPRGAAEGADPTGQDALSPAAD